MPGYSTRINWISFGTAPGFSALAKRDPFGATPGPSRGYFTLTFGDPARDTPGYSISNPSRFPTRPSYYVQNTFHKYKWNILYTDFMNINHTLTSLHARFLGCFDVKSLGSITLAGMKKNVVIKKCLFSTTVDQGLHIGIGLRSCGFPESDVAVSWSSLHCGLQIMLKTKNWPHEILSSLTTDNDFHDSVKCYLSFVSKNRSYLHICIQGEEMSLLECKRLFRWTV